MPIGSILGSIAAPVIGGLIGGSMGGGGGGSPNYYVPTGLGAADAGWQGLFGQGQNLAGGAYSSASPAFNQSLKALQGINYSPIGTAGQQAGDIYSGLAGTALGQMGLYGALGGQDLGQQQSLYNAGQNVYNLGLDPQQSLYNRTAQQLSDQINAAQAMRGLGNSPQGLGEYNQAMGNFNIDWQNNLLNRALSGLQGLSSASGAGAQQGNLAGQNLLAQLGAGQQGAGFTQQAAQVPISAQQQVAAMPATNASQYLSWLQPLQQVLGNQASLAIPYMNYGQGAQQQNYSNVAAQNAANTQLGSNIGGAIGNSNWFQGLFNSSPGTFNAPTASYSAPDWSSMFSSSGYPSAMNTGGLFP